MHLNVDADFESKILSVRRVAIFIRHNFNSEIVCLKQLVVIEKAIEPKGWVSRIVVKKKLSRAI